MLARFALDLLILVVCGPAALLGAALLLALMASLIGMG